MLVYEEGGKPENPEKKPRSKDENQQQTQPTYDAGSVNRTRDTLVGGERSHYCANPAPLSVLYMDMSLCKHVQDSLYPPPPFPNISDKMVGRTLCRCSFFLPVILKKLSHIVSSYVVHEQNYL